MPKKNDLEFVIRSRGWDLIRDKEKETGETISVESLVKKGELARGTIRKFFDERDADVSGMGLRAAQHAADLIGVSLCELVYKAEMAKASATQEEDDQDVNI